MSNKVILLFLFAPALRLQAQYNDLLQSDKISWVAEYTADYELNPVYSDFPGKEYNLLDLIRLSNTNPTNGLYADTDLNYPFYLSQQIYAGLSAGQFACFADSALLTPLTSEQVSERLNRLDTMPSDAVKFQTIMTFRVRQVLYYNRSTRTIGACLLALAPVVHLPDPDGNLIARGPLLWIKTPEYNKKQRRQLMRNATYSWQTRMKDNAPRLEDLIVKKGRPDFREWARTETLAPSHRCLTYDTYQPLNRAALKALVFTTDTLTQLNEDGVSEVQQVIQKDATNQVERIRLVQHWYFDAQNGRVCCEVVAAAPLAAVRSPEGIFRYEKPLFYVKY